eukprot:s2963_g3.t1
MDLGVPGVSSYYRLKGRLIIEGLIGEPSCALQRLFDDGACPGFGGVCVSWKAFDESKSPDGRDHVPEVPTNFRSQLVHEISHYEIERRYETRQLLGQGSYGSVHLVCERTTQQKKA